MSDQVSAAPSRPSYLFVDSVRFWSMLGIVAMHSILTVRTSPAEGYYPLAVLSLFKFGTIAFFLISGFLFGDRLDRVDPVRYLGRRLRTLLLPWALWLLLYIAFAIVLDVAGHRILLHSASSWWQVSRAETAEAVVESWFVPNLAICMCVLVPFRRFVNDIRFGILLFAINLVYVANIYFHWFGANHRSAVFGFVCFLWLGAFAAKNFDRLRTFVDGIPMSVLAGCAVLSYVLSLAEVFLLIQIHSAEMANTLRPTNQIFSVAVVVLLMKLKSKSWPDFVNVRQQTYCVYLVHAFFIRIAFGGLNKIAGPAFMMGGYPKLSFPLRIAVFAFAYGGSLLVGRAILSSERLRWTIGMRSSSA